MSGRQYFFPKDEFFLLSERGAAKIAQAREACQGRGYVLAKANLRGNFRFGATGFLPGQAGRREPFVRDHAAGEKRDEVKLPLGPQCRDNVDNSRPQNLQIDKLKWSQVSA